MPKVTGLSLPSIHMNGTSRGDLLEGYRAAFLAVRDASEAIAKAAPHLRDYYPQGDNAGRLAIEQHRARLQKLAEIESELETIGMHINDFPGKEPAR